MAAPTTKGRMIRRDVSRSQKVASLSKESIILFLMLIPHFSIYGKMNGSPHYVKGEVVPLLEWFTVERIEKCLGEINAKTNVKWFEKDGLLYIHAINWEEHQEVRTDRAGKDDLPNYSGSSPGLVLDKSGISPGKVPLEREREKERENEIEKVVGKSGSSPGLKAKKKNLSEEEWLSEIKQNPAYQGIDIDREKGKMEAWCLTKGVQPTRGRFLNWLNKAEKPLRTQKGIIQGSRFSATALAMIDRLGKEEGDVPT